MQQVLSNPKLIPRWDTIAVGSAEGPSLVSLAVTLSPAGALHGRLGGSLFHHFSLLEFLCLSAFGFNWNHRGIGCQDASGKLQDVFLAKVRNSTKKLRAALTFWADITDHVPKCGQF